ncbi:MAG: helix-turn-helix domain-containing protein [Pyrinomonadaceae bacterium]|nr:helix-turn-helix domain-containing protein [Pyrinomonadaceae bacterium]
MISVHGVVFAHYDVRDRAAEAYAMITLSESGYATQTQIAQSFGYAARSLRRYQERFETGGVGALVRGPGRPSGSRSGREKERGGDQTILHLKAKGSSNRAIAGRLGLSEKAIRKRLRRLGWQPSSESDDPCLPFQQEASGDAPHAADTENSIDAINTIAPPDTAQRQPRSNEDSQIELPTASRDPDPLNRSMDRLLAAMGLLEDAVPLFVHADSLARAGVLLAIPSLVSSAVLSIARKIYGTIGPAFYGLRTTLVACILLALLRIPRPETLKEYAPGNLGRIIGLDRVPEVKTLRRKLARLASRKASQQLGRELARHRIAERGRVFGFLYLDGHVRAYHGKHNIAKAYLTRARLAVPATTDYWVNDRKGEPLFVVTAEANAQMTHMLIPILEQARRLLGPPRRITIVFDRGGWSPKLFEKLLAMGFDILTYRKGRVRRVAEKRFFLRKTKFDGRPVKYLLHDQPVRFLKGKLRLRQVTRLTDGGHQTPVLTSRWDLRDIGVAYRMFERWRQENFFKYMRQEFLIDALTDYQVEPDDPERSVPNPARKAVDKELRKARSHLNKIKQTYGAAFLDYFDGRTPTTRAFTAAEKKIHLEIQEATDRLTKLVARQKSLPARVPLAEARPGQDLVKLSTERKHLTNVLKLVAYQIESDLVNLIRPHYARTEDEGRTLIQAALQSTAALEPTKDELRVTLSPLSSPHRSQAVAALCETLNKTETRFPGTDLRMRFALGVK